MSKNVIFWTFGHCSEAIICPKIRVFLPFCYCSEARISPKLRVFLTSGHCSAALICPKTRVLWPFRPCSAPLVCPGMRVCGFSPMALRPRLSIHVDFCKLLCCPHLSKTAHFSPAPPFTASVHAGGAGLSGAAPSCENNRRSTTSGFDVFLLLSGAFY